MAQVYNTFKRITNAGIVDGTLTGSDLGNSSVTNAKFADLTITNAKVGTDAVTDTKMSDSTVAASNLADSAVSLTSSDVTGTNPVSKGGTGLSSVTDNRALKVNNAGNALEWNYSGVVSCQVWTSNGTWNKAAGCTRIKVQVVGGGGGGTGHGEAGGAGGYAEEIIDVTSISSVAITIGGGGGGVNYHNSAGNGGTTSFGPYLSAGGGEGARRVGGHSGGRPGSGSGGNMNYPGGGGAGHTHYGGGKGGSSFWGGASIGVHWQGPQVSDQEGRAAPGTGGTGASNARRRGGTGRSGMVVVWNIR